MVQAPSCASHAGESLRRDRSAPAAREKVMAVIRTDARDLSRGCAGIVWGSCGGREFEVMLKELAAVQDTAPIQSRDCIRVRACPSLRAVAGIGKETHASQPDNARFFQPGARVRRLARMGCIA